MLKAYYVRANKKMPPYIHNLVKLAKQSNIYITMTDEQKNILDEFEPLNIEARYPSYKDELMKSLNKKKCEKFLYKAEELFKWIKEKL